MIANILKLWTEFALLRFIVVGSFRTLLGFILYSLLVLLMPYYIAITVSYIVGIISSYVLNSIIVFKRVPEYKKAILFPSVYIIQYIVVLLTVTVMVEFMYVGGNLAYLFGIGIAIPITYLISRFVIIDLHKS